MERLWKVLTRKKAVEQVSSEESRLHRVLNTFDLTAMGVGSTLGVGVYVLAGQVAKDTTGPSVVLSFLIAAIASAFAALCYAEFGARVPKAGSAYVYSYVCVGELVAFVIGWNLILEYVIGAASVGKGLSLYLDKLLNHTMQNTFMDIAPINVPYLSQYFDFFAFGIPILLSFALAFGLKKSSMVNNIFTVLNIFVVIFVVIAGSFHVNIKNWSLPGNSSDPAVGKGGFFPFGVENMIKGAATCFYGFVGFDCIATAGEEVRNPRKAIPFSIVWSLFIIFLAYFGTSAITTLMVPYYEMDKNTPLPHAFDTVGWEWAKWVITIGGIFGLSASLFGAMFPLPRIVFAMGADGIIFKFLAKVHPRFQTPVVGTLLAGLLTGFMAALFDLDQLVNMMSIGTLLAYTLVAVSVLLLRYADNKQIDINNDEGPSVSQENLISVESVTSSGIFGQFFNCSRQKNPSQFSERLVMIEISIYCLLCVLLGVCAIFLKHYIMQAEIWAIALTAIVVILTVIVIMSIATQPTSAQELSFKVPCVPLIPALSIMVNIYLMLQLDVPTWVRFGVWMVLGLPMYFYCVRNSTLPKSNLYKSNLLSPILMNNNKGVNKTNFNGFSNKSFENDIRIKTGVEKNMDEATQLNGKCQGISDMNGLSKEKDIKIQEEAVIAQLDEILDREANDICERKLSVGNVSNVSSAVAFHKENVIADVHRCDSFSAPNPSAFVQLTTFELPTVTHTNFSINTSGLKDNKEFIDDCDNHASQESSSVDTSSTVKAESINVLNNVSNAGFEEQRKMNEQFQSNSVDVYYKPTKIKQESLAEQASQENVQKNKSNLAISLSTPSPIELVEDLEGKSVEVVTPRLTETCPDTPPPTPSSVGIMQNMENDAIIIPRPTLLTLKSVTLRRVKKKEPDSFSDKSDEGSNENLKLTSEQGKLFLEKLNNKLKRHTAPSYFAVPAMQKLEAKNIDNPVYTPNENVIEENINIDLAKSKFSNFIENRLVNIDPQVDTQNSENEGSQYNLTQNESKLLINDINADKVNDFIDNNNKMNIDQQVDTQNGENYRSKSSLTQNDSKVLIGDINAVKVDPCVDHGNNINNDPEVNTQSRENEGSQNHLTQNESKVLISDVTAKKVDAFIDHKNKMQNIFSTINLKRVESFKNDNLNKYKSKSLGPSLTKSEDKSAHIQNMEDIFNSIKALRKESKVE